MKTLVNVDEMVLNPPELGCVLYLPGLPNSGNKICDRSPYGNHGTITGATWVKTEGGLWCLSFDGTDDDVNIGDISRLNFAGDSSFTVMAWVNLDSSKPANYHAIISKFDWANAKGWLLEVHNVRGLEFQLNNNAAGAETASFLTDNMDKWTHVAGIKKSISPLKLVINGTEPTYTAQDNGVDITSPAGLNAMIGDRADVTAHHAKGRIARPKAINSALSILEVTNIYNREKNLFGV